ncbi:hypothetical protein SAMN05421743_103261 [Thalassobacillus cyri]|uniref:Copper resistance protein D n=1 Tax=Thalassobacillus cyri TaxID=571932 RepID=A0A1H3ZIT5_9BACI|nr:hypothetical protein [Thalassobacillus cyri]SEA23620.1 hypothetical protein SAMN05421743_103261 [Thalassobacillus cyri]
MNFFAIFSIVWGVLMIGIRSLIHLIPKSWNEFELNQVYKEKKPRWVWALAAISLGIVFFTWYKELTTAVPYSLLLTILVTLTLVKVSQLVFNYKQFRGFVKKALVEDRQLIRKINAGTTIVGIILIILGIYVY